MPEKNSPISWAPAAKRDLRDTWRYFEGVASVEVADRLLRDILRASERAHQRPLAWRARDEVMPGLRSILVHPYLLFYRVKVDTIEVVRVLHQRQNFPVIFQQPKR
jgi:toxin ParE1/3/4